MKTVLLITRDANLTELVESSISSEFRLSVASGEEGAAKAMGSEKASLLLVDFNLGKLDGLTVLERLMGRFGVFSNVVLLAPEKIGDVIITRANGQFVEKVLKRPITSRMIKELLEPRGESEREDRATILEFLAEALRDSPAQRIDLAGRGLNISLLLEGGGVYGILHPHFGAAYHKMMEKAGVKVKEKIPAEDIDAMGRLESRLSSSDGFQQAKTNALLSVFASLPLHSACSRTVEGCKIPSGLVEVKGHELLFSLVEYLPLDFLTTFKHPGIKLKTKTGALSTHLNLRPLHGWILSQCSSSRKVRDLLKTGVFPEKELLPGIYLLLLLGLMNCTPGNEGSFRIKHLVERLGLEDERIIRESKAIESLCALVLEKGQNPYTILGVKPESSPEDILRACKNKQAVLKPGALHPGVYEKYNKDILLLQARYSEALLLLQSAQMEDRLQKLEEEGEKVSRGPTRLGGSKTRKEQAAERRKKTAGEMLAKARLLYDDENFHEASQILRLSLLQDPYSHEAHCLMARIYEKSPNAKAKHMAEREFLRAVELDPWRVSYMLDLADFYARNNQAVRSAVFLKKAKAIEKKNARMKNLENDLESGDMD